MVKKTNNNILVGVIYGSKSDLPVMNEATKILDQFNIGYESEVVSAHRTPDKLYEYAKSAKDRKLQVIIAGAGGAAHLPGMTASLTTIPVIAVPVQSKHLSGIDSLLSIVQMPKGIPVATLAIGEAGAVNAALLAVSILALNDEILAKKLKNYRQELKKQALS